MQRLALRPHLRRSPLRPLRRAPPRRPQSTAPPTLHDLVNNPPVLIRSNQSHSPLGLAFLAIIPLTAFALGVWQIHRLRLKTALIATLQDRLLRDPLPLPPRVDPAEVKNFDHRRVVAEGVWMHDREMLLGPRTRDGRDGFFVVTPLSRADGPPVLVNRGWIPRSRAAHSTRSPSALPTGRVRVQGLLRPPWKRNAFSPTNAPNAGAWHFPDVAQMARHAGAQEVWVEETMEEDLLEAYRREEMGVPLARQAEVGVRNGHAQYIFVSFGFWGWGG